MVICLQLNLLRLYRMVTGKYHILVPNPKTNKKFNGIFQPTPKISCFFYEILVPFITSLEDLGAAT